MTLSPSRRELSAREFALALAVIVCIGAVLRGLFPAADPPWHATVGIVWHDEGAWVHNARNRALFGAWSLDAWNPMFVAPVFTVLEYLSFATFGVGVRQARLVPELLGVVSVWLIGLGVARLAGRPAGLIAAALLATNYVYVMWNRAALMEAPMTAFMVASWYCTTRAARAPRWAWGAAACGFLAFFTKAAAAFFIAALALDAAVALMTRPRGSSERRYGIAMLAALTVCGSTAVALFVLPNWADYWFYNIQMSVTRKPTYDVTSLLNRVTWFPILHDLFTRMWLELALAMAAVVALASRLRRAEPGERLLLLWVGLGTLELLLHDVGNERRFVFFIPALVALAAVLLGRDRTLVPPSVVAVSRARALVAAPVVAYALYIVIGAAVRLAFLYEVQPNVRLAAGLAGALTIGLYATWPRIPRALSAGGWSPATALALTGVIAAGQVAQYAQWAAGRTYKNYDASRALARILPSGTLVHGKLANGLSLENRIKPVFIGRGFGNYADRKTRDDVRYILTYIAPSVGYESQRTNPVIQDVLDAYPDHTIIMTFDVAETASGRDRAALIDKFGREED